MTVMMGEGRDAYHWYPPPEGTVPFKLGPLLRLQQELLVDFGKSNAGVGVEL
jgi:hypothetical protein